MFHVLVRRSTARYGSAVGGLLALFYLLQNQGWVGDWQGGVVAVATSSVFLTTSTVFCAALDSRRLHPPGKSSFVRPAWASARSAVGIVVAAWLPGAVWLVALLGTTVALTGRDGPVVSPGAAALVLPFVFLVAYAALGFVLGQLLPLLGIVPASIVVGFVLPVALSGTPNSRAGLLTPVDDGAIGGPFLFDQTTLARQCAIGVFFAAACIAFGLSLRRTPSRPRAARSRLTAAAVLLVAAALVWTQGSSTRSYVAHNATGPRECARVGAGRVCVWALNPGVRRPAYAAWNALARAIPSAWTGAPTGAVEEGLSHTAREIPFYVGTDTVSLDDMAAEFAELIVARLSCDDAAAGPTPTPSPRVQWLLDRAGLITPSAVSPATRRILTLKESDQVTWWLRARPPGCS
jgi:hypothetical protein